MIGWRLGARLGGGGYVRLGDPSRLAGVAVVSSAVCGAAGLVAGLIAVVDGLSEYDVLSFAARPAWQPSW